MTIRDRHKRTNIVSSRLRNLLRITFLVVILFATMLALCGCRYSEALYEIKTDQLNGEYEPRANPEYKDVDGAPEDPTKASTHLTDSENQTEQTNELPVYSPDGDYPGLANQPIHDATTNDEEEAASGTEASEEDGSSTTSEDESDEGDGAGDDGKGADESSDTGDPDPDDSAGRGGRGQTYGDDNYDELPEARAVAAKGNYAFIAQMLGGKGAVAGTDKQWKSKVKDANAFPKEGVQDIPVLWKGKDGSSLDIDALLKTNADVVFVDGVECTLTAKEERRLKKEGVNIVNVPALGFVDTSDKDIESAITVVAQVLSGKNAQTQYDATEMADNWVSVHDGTIDDCLEVNEGYSYKILGGSSYDAIYKGNKDGGEPTNNLSDNRIITAYVDSLVSANKSYSTADRSWGDNPLHLDGQMIDLRDGVGLSVRVNQGNFALIDYYLQVAGVVNNAYEGAKPTDALSTKGKTLPYAIIAGNAAGMYAPLGSRINSSALWVPVFSMDDWTCVGDPEFPGLIVRNKDIADSIVKSASKLNGLYNVGNPYWVRVIPEGIAGSWADGTPESFLLSVWAFDVFNGDAPNESKSYIDQYYELFYRIENASASGVIEDLDQKMTAVYPK